MKTPREILLERHHAVGTRLDVIRHEVVESIKRPSILDWPNLLWRELIWPSRRIWAGLAVVWFLILAVNTSMQEHSQVIVAKTSPTLEMIQAWRQQERVLTELFGPNKTRVAEPPKPYSPQPSSERRFENLMT